MDDVRLHVSTCHGRQWYVCHTSPACGLAWQLSIRDCHFVLRRGMWPGCAHLVETMRPVSSSVISIFCYAREVLLLVLEESCLSTCTLERVCSNFFFIENLTLVRLWVSWRLRALEIKWPKGSRSRKRMIILDGFVFLLILNSKPILCSYLFWTGFTKTVLIEADWKDEALDSPQQLLVVKVGKKNQNKQGLRIMGMAFYQ
jgi:hypothetical protein